MKSKLLRTGLSLLVLEPKDEVVETLIQFAKNQKIVSGSFQAIGALYEVTFAYWNAGTKEYEHIGLQEQVEVVSLIGNIARGEGGEPKIHAHIAIGRQDGRMLGGHLINGRVFPTLEVFLSSFDTPVQRKQDPETKLHLITLE